MLGDAIYTGTSCRTVDVQHLAIPTADPFSLYHAGAPWIAHEWLAEIVYGQPTHWPAGPRSSDLAARLSRPRSRILARYLLRYIEPLLRPGLDFHGVQPGVTDICLHAPILWWRLS